MKKKSSCIGWICRIWTFSLLFLGCGSATVATSPTSENSHAAAGESPKSPGCYTDPEMLARDAANAARDLGMEAVTATLTMNRVQFEKLMTVAGAKDKGEAAWQAHHSELAGGIERIRKCTAGSISLRGVHREEAPFEFYEASFGCTSADGSMMVFKVKQAALDGCLYVGYMG